MVGATGEAGIVAGESGQRRFPLPRDTADEPGLQEERLKNQYFGDVNDYLKFGLLRVLGEAARLRVGVAWMLTPDDGRSDGSRTGYRQRSAWRVHDPDLYDRLASLDSGRRARRVSWMRRWKLVPDALDFDALVPEAAAERERWMRSALRALAGCPVLFFDPDNGFEVKSVPRGRRCSNKYLYWDEACAAWTGGHSLLVYQHFARRDRDAHACELYACARGRLRDARVTLFRSAHVLFLLAARPEHAAALARAADRVGERWSGRIEVARAEPGDRARASASTGV
jgi:hypothetical protein